MNTFVLKNKLTRIRKSGTYSRLLQKHKKRIIPQIPEKCPDQNYCVGPQHDASSSVLSSAISGASNEASQATDNDENTQDTEDSNEILEGIVENENCQGSLTSEKCPDQNYYVGPQHDASSSVLSSTISGASNEASQATYNDENTQDTEDSNEILEDIVENENCQGSLTSEIRNWASEYQISQAALKSLIGVLNTHLQADLPKDPRTLMRTPRTLEIITMKNDGKYWHHGLERGLQNHLKHVTMDMNISININIDGLPIYKSSANHFWPILANIHELPHISPIIVGIYYGASKPKDANEFLSPLVKELTSVLDSGVIINNHRISVKIRAFICDSPARAFIKCVANFNGKFGCLKCTTKGKYSHETRTMIFPEVNAELRTNQMFRENKYPEHQRTVSLLTELPINMIDDVIVGDALHLLELGIMRKLINSWRTGSMSKRAKWSVYGKQLISEYLVGLRFPVEIHRRMRSLEHISLWKGLEYRIFLNYVGVVLLKDHLPSKYYEHFLLLFCAVRICSVERYKKFLPIARMLFLQFVNDYKILYGTEFITSNVHNLCHVTDEVEKFGTLISLSAYPFENCLHSLKKLVKPGPNPLVQIANRIIEAECNENASTIKQNTSKSTIINAVKNEKICKVTFPEFILTNKYNNKWFLTNNLEIVGMTDIHEQNDEILIKGQHLLEKHNFFQDPMNSSFLHVFSTKLVKDNFSNVECFRPNSVLCKMVPIDRKDKTIFIPLMHTMTNVN